jgi:hypothetical protein
MYVFLIVMLQRIIMVHICFYFYLPSGFHVNQKFNKWVSFNLSLIKYAFYTAEECSRMAQSTRLPSARGNRYLIIESIIIIITMQTGRDLFLCHNEYFYRIQHKTKHLYRIDFILRILPSAC